MNIWPFRIKPDPVAARLRALEREVKQLKSQQRTTLLIVRAQQKTIEEEAEAGQ